MPWWTWIVIWVALLALAALFLVLLGFHLYRKITSALREVGRAEDLLHATAGAGTAPAQGREVPGLAVFRDPADLRVEQAVEKSLRVSARQERRIRRRAANGRPQLLGDLPHL